MALEDGFGHDPSQPIDQDYVLSATGLVSRTFGLWSRKLAQYIIIIGLFGAVCGGVSFILLFTLFESIGTIAADPISSFYSFFMYATFPSTPFITATILFSLIAFVINAIVVGATIKFTLDDYSGIEADIFIHPFLSRIDFISYINCDHAKSCLADCLYGRY